MKKHNILKDFLDVSLIANEKAGEYIFGKNTDLDEIAKKIWAASKWVFDRNATTVINKNIELEEFNNSTKEIKIKYNKMSLQDTLHDLTLKQAKMIWFFKGCKTNNSLEEEKDNFYHAKRYIAFLISDMILSNCYINKRCPEESLKWEYVEYLQGLTIEEFIRFKAYLKWHDRPDKNSLGNKSFHLKDYLTSMGFLDMTMINCKNTRCQESAAFWKKIIERKNLSQQKEILNIIKKAKINSLKRLLKNNRFNIQYINNFVENFYDNLLNIVSKRTTTDKAIKNIINSIYKNASVINMFEFILKCLLLAKLDHKEHNDIRTKNSKLVLNL